MPHVSTQETETRTQFTRESIIDDFRIAVRSRHASLIGRKEVLTGKAKFGIFGDGKEVAQLAWARAFRRGDWRSGYYRDQTFMLALGAATLEEFFAQLYADADVEHDPWSGGRSMNAHFASRSSTPTATGSQVDAYNVSADVSPTGSQMPRLVGLAWASRLYRELDLPDAAQFSRNGDEIAWGTIGNASCAEGMFWESLNAGGVLGIPMIVSIWDDGYGISVPNEPDHQGQSSPSCSKASSASRNRNRATTSTPSRRGTTPRSARPTSPPRTIVRMEHVPAIIHVTESRSRRGIRPPAATSATSRKSAWSGKSSSTASARCASG
jgi:2-oxoisovalerate dehydrogenase E1 component